VWSLFVVILAPGGDLPSDVKQVLKPTDPQALFAQPPVKAFDMRVLRGLTGLDMRSRPGPNFGAFREKEFAGQGATAW
jgi:hypothetical protein